MTKHPTPWTCERGRSTPYGTVASIFDANGDVVFACVNVDLAEQVVVGVNSKATEHQDRMRWFNGILNRYIIGVLIVCAIAFLLSKCSDC